METLFIYLIKSSALIATFFLAYYFLLRKETFFKSNRWFLLAGLVTSLILPLVTFKKIVWVNARPELLSYADLPVGVDHIAPVPGFEVDWYLVIAAIYVIGILNFLMEFAFDFKSLVRTLKGQPVKQQADFKFVDVEAKVSPFSYFNYIVYNSSLYSESELENILEHEKVHCEQRHSADVLIARFFCILFWYNPFIWLYKKAMLQNLEFIADNEALKNISDTRGEAELSVAKKAYQFTLLKVTTHENCVEITNHFFQSLIKKRIIMLNKNQSKKWQSWKYLLIIPALAAFMFYFQVNVIAQEKSDSDRISSIGAFRETIVIERNTTDAQMKEHSEMMQKKYGVKLKFSKIKRNKSNELIGFKAEYKDKENHKGTYVISGDEPIKPTHISVNDNGTVAFGSPKQIRIIRRDNDDDNITETITHSDSDGDEDYDTDDMAEAPEPPMPPEMITEEYRGTGNGDKVVIRHFKNKDGKMVMSVNGETIDVDVADALASVDWEGIQAEVQAQLEIATRQMEDARPQIERAQREIENIRPRTERSRRELDQAKEDLEQSKRDLEESRREFEASKKEFEQQKTAIKAKFKAEAEANKK